MFLSELNGLCAESIRVHHASGHFTTAEATARLKGLDLDDTQAAQVLAAPVDDGLFVKYRTWPKEN